MGSNKTGEHFELRRLGRRAGRPLLLACTLPIVSGFLLLGQAWLLAHVLHCAISEQAELGSLAGDVLALVGLIGGRALLGIAAETAGISASERIKLSLRQELFGNLMHRQTDWKSSRASGSVAAALLDQIEALDGYFARFLPAVIQATLLPLAFAIVVVPFDWVAGMLFLVTAPLIPLFMALVGWGAEAASRQQATAMTRLSGMFADRLRGILTLNLFGRADSETLRVRETSDDLRRRSLKVLRIAFLSSAVLEFFAALGVAGVALYIGLTYLGFIDMRTTVLTLEAGIFCLLMAPEVYQPLRLLAAHYHDKQTAKAAVDEIALLLGDDDTTAIDMPKRTETLLPGAHALSIRDLDLRTPDGRHGILDRASLDLRAGAHAVLIGESGIGKSTLLDAIAGMKDFNGNIQIGAHPIQMIQESSFRESLAYVGQAPFLFAGTIADNIRLGAPQASEHEMRTAAKLACVTDFADLLPDGLDTKIGERGLGLSGGEAHRVALARLFLRDPGLILLDEPTAHLDAGTEALIIEALVRFAEGRTMLIATHSTSLAKRIGDTFRIEDRTIVKQPAVSTPLPLAKKEAAA